VFFIVKITAVQYRLNVKWWCLIWATFCVAIFHIFAVEKRISV